MTEQEIYDHLSYCRKMIGQNEQRIASLQKDNSELDQLGTKLSSLTNGLNSFPDTAQGTIARLKAAVTQFFVQETTSILHGTAYSRAVQGISDAYKTVLRKISANDEEIRQCRGRISYYYNEMNRCNIALRQLLEEAQQT